MYFANIPPTAIVDKITRAKTAHTIVLMITAINLTGNLPLDVPLKGTIDANSPIFSETLNAGESAVLTFTITWDENNSDPSGAGKTDILELRIAVEQVD